MKRTQGNLWFNVLIIIGLTFFGLFIALFDSVDIVFESLKNVNILNLLIIIGWGMMPTLLWGVNLTLMVRHILPKYSFKSGVINAFVGGFVSGITPSSTGGQLAQINTFTKQGVRTSQAVGLVWMDFYLYTLTIVLVGCTMFVLNIDVFQNQSIVVLFALGLGIKVIIIAFLSLMVVNQTLSEKLTQWILNGISKQSWIKRRHQFKNQWGSSLHRFHDAIGEIQTRRGSIVLLLSLNVLRLIVFFSTPYVIGRVIGLDLVWADLAHVLTLSTFIMIANTFIPLPGASGVTEGVYVLVYSSLLGREFAASTMILWRFATFHVVVLTGAVLFLRLRGLRFKDMKTTTLQSVNSENDMNEV